MLRRNIADAFAYKLCQCTRASQLYLLFDGERGPQAKVNRGISLLLVGWHKQMYENRYIEYFVSFIYFLVGWHALAVSSPLVNIILPAL
jgi:hypothetical protein